MADVITRFKLETTQYDSKLRDTAKGLADFAKQASLAGNEFGKFTQKNVEAARSFGSIATSATNSKEKVKELVGAFNQVANAYNALTKEQQQSDFGKAMAESMQQLQGRIKEAKAEMNDTGGILGQLKDKFTVNIDALKLFNAGLTSVNAALDVAKDAFFSNEQSLDEWGRVVESSESLYKGFLDALNTGDISGYLQNIDNITNAARAAYNALDELNTFNAFNQRNVQKARTSMTESIANYRGGTGSKDAVKAAGEAYKKELAERKKLENEAYIEAVGKAAAERGVSKQDLLTALSGTYGSYKALKDMPMSGTQTVYYGGGMFGGGGSYEKEVPNSIQERLGSALRRLNDTELEYLQSLGAQADRTGEEIANIDKQVNRVLNGRQGDSSNSGGGRSGRGSTNNQPEYLDFYKQQLKSISGDSLKNEIEHISVFDMFKDQAKFDPENILGSKDAWEDYKDTIAGAIGDIGDSMDNLTTWTKDFDPYKEKMDELSKTAKQNMMAMNLAGQAVGSFSQALSGMEDPGAKAAGMVVGALASIAFGFAQAAAAKDTVGSGWAWLVWMVAGLSAMATAIGTVHNLTGFAEGGIVGGNSYSGDNVYAGNAWVNSGELILNKAQQNSVASQLNGNGLQNIAVSGRVKGTDIILSIDRSLQLQGKQLLTWGR